MTTIFYAVINNRHLLAEFDTKIEAEKHAADIPGSIVTPMTVPGRE